MTHASPAAAVPAAPKEERNWAMFCHLVAFTGCVVPLGNIIGPLMMWLLKREEWLLVDDQGREALNFQISWTIYFAVSIVLCFVLIGLLLVPLLLLTNLILVVRATVQASEGVRFRYPGTMQFV